MRNKELQVTHDEIWREIYERQKQAPELNVGCMMHCVFMIVIQLS